MYFEWNASPARNVYLLKILGAWTAAIGLSMVPVLMALNAVTL
jgi:hypothetical protein